MLILTKDEFEEAEKGLTVQNNYELPLYPDFIEDHFPKLEVDQMKVVMQGNVILKYLSYSVVHKNPHLKGQGITRRD